MTKLTAELMATVDMARSVGIRQTSIRVSNYLAARSYERARQRRFNRLGLQGRGPTTFGPPTRSTILSSPRFSPHLGKGRRHRCW